MLFNTIDFLIFFCLVYSAYLILPHKGQNILLLVASYYFYGSWDWRFLSLLLLSTGVDYALAIAIDRSDDPRRRRFYLIISMCVSLGVLGFFKYFNFFAESLQLLLARVGWSVDLWHLNVILPWGISFYTFQTMNYTIDVYRRHLRAERHFPNFALFVAFYPHLVAGPIMRASDLLPQVQQPRVVTAHGIRQGLWLVLWGLFQKMVIADNLAIIADAHYAGAPKGWSGAWLGTYAFAFQILCDFSAYSDIARGVGQLMGFNLMRNFRNPYFALNPSDFWRRWHISLSTWLRDYLYIPLGGNRRGRARTYINLMITMLLGGLWHGASWTFVAWGLYHGLLLAVHRFVTGEDQAPRRRSGVYRLLCMLAMFHLTCLGWVFFRAHSFSQAWQFLGALAGPSGWDLNALNDALILGLLVLPVLAMQALMEVRNDLYAALKLSLIPRAMIYAALVVSILLFANTGSQAFIYFQF